MASASLFLGIPLQYYPYIARAMTIGVVLLTGVAFLVWPNNFLAKWVHKKSTKSCRSISVRFALLMFFYAVLAALEWMAYFWKLEWLLTTAWCIGLATLVGVSAYSWYVHKNMLDID